MLKKIVDGRTDLVFDYLENGKDPSTTDENGISLMQWCGYYGDVSAIRYLLQLGASLDEMGPNYSLGAVAFHGHWRLCQYLIENGADANQADAENGETPLHACLSKNRTANRNIVEVLLAAGADPNAKTIPGKETGCFMRDVSTKGETPLHRAAAFGDAETIEMLVEAGGDKTLRDADGDSPLTWASLHLRPGAILALLAHGDHTIHPLHVERMKSDHGFGGPDGMETNLLGRVNK